MSEPRGVSSLPFGHSVGSEDWRDIKPCHVEALQGPTNGFLCPLSANTFGIDFCAFKIRDLDSNTTLFDVRKPDADPSEDGQQQMPPPNSEADWDGQCRTIRYHFGPDFLKLHTVGTTLEFKVGTECLRNFRMVERHYLRNRLIKSFDFTMPFCMANSTNTWEVMYELPEFSEEERALLVASPWECRSDSFYFVDNTLVMHNKAEYSYAEDV